MDLAETVVDHNESPIDLNQRSIDSAVGCSGGRGGDSNEEYAANEGARSGSGGIVIRTMEQRSNALKLGNLSQVEKIHLTDGQEIWSGHFTLAEALASGKMSALKNLWLWHIGSEDDRSEAVCNALTSGRFPCLSLINFSGNMVGTKGVNALGRAIQFGNLEKLEMLGLEDDDMATLAEAFQHGETSLVPNLAGLGLSNNPFTEVGLQALLQVLISGHLDSLQRLDVMSSSMKSAKQRANALLSAFAGNNCLTVEVYFDRYGFLDIERQQIRVRQRNMKNKDISAGLLDSPMVPAAFGEVFLCGSTKVGKTTLSHTLQRGFWEALFTWQRSLMWKSAQEA